MQVRHRKYSCGHLLLGTDVQLLVAWDMVNDIRSRDVDRSITCHHVFCNKTRLYRLCITAMALTLTMSLHKSRYAQEIEEKFPKVCDNGVES